MRIGLFGQFGTGNSGNDGSLESMLGFLQDVQPDAELICFCPDPEVVTLAYGLRAVGTSVRRPAHGVRAFLDGLLFKVPGRLRNLSWAVAKTRGLDLILVPGTGFLDDFNDTPFGWPYVILRWFLAARLVRVPIFLVSIGAGPIHHPLSRAFMKAAARMAAFRSYRDRGSLDYMRSIGIDVARDTVCGDLAFRLDSPEDPRDRRGGQPVVGVGLMNYAGWKRSGDANATYATYLEKMTDLVNWLPTQGISARLLTGDRGDRRAIEDLLSRIAPQHTASSIIYEPIESLHDVMRQIAQTDIVVATRYHNVVCALRLTRPTISLSYAAKNDELLRATGLGDYCHHVETFDLDVVKLQIRMLLQLRLTVERDIRLGVDAFRARLDEQGRVIDGALLSIRDGTRHVPADERLA